MVNLNVKKLAEQLDKAQAILDEIRITSGCDAFGPRKEAKRVETALEAAVRAYQDRRSRKDFLGSDDIFGEPAWDMLLDLFIRQTKEEQVSVKTACFNANAPTPTTIRWLTLLQQNGLVMTEIDPADKNQHLIHLTAEGYEGMLRYLESIAI